MEVDLCRERLKKFCVGNGCDLGFGGVPIVPTAICVDREEWNTERAKHNSPHPTQLVGDARNLHWFRSGCLDYVFSSHCIEDFEDTQAVLWEWLRVIRPGGHLVLYAPDQALYLAYCEKTGDCPNQAHKHPSFGLGFVKDKLFDIGIHKSQIVWELSPAEIYSFDCVVRK